MNDSRPAGQPVRRESRPGSRSARRRKQNKRFQRFLLIHQLVLVLIAMGIGYFLGVHAASSTAAPAETQPPETTSPQIQTSTDPADTTAPRILGVNRLSMFLGGTIAYRSGILVTDDTDPAPMLTVDSSQVDLSTPGTYPVIYTATDSSGNAANTATTITVVEAPDTRVDESVINEKADKILSRIITDDMTPEQQVNAIYDYIESHHYYIADFDKSDYMQAAYLMMTENRGDCFGYYAIARLFFERLGLPNLSVTRLENEVRTSSHYWNMVSLDGGETWYHFDSTPHLTYPTRTCLITDADLEAFNELMPNYYYFDQNSFPRTPVE